MPHLLVGCQLQPQDLLVSALKVRDVLKVPMVWPQNMVAERVLVGIQLIMEMAEEIPYSERVAAERAVAQTTTQLFIQVERVVG